MNITMKNLKMLTFEAVEQGEYSSFEDAITASPIATAAEWNKIAIEVEDIINGDSGFGSVAVGNDDVDIEKRVNADGEVFINFTGSASNQSWYFAIDLKDANHLLHAISEM